MNFEYTIEQRRRYCAMVGTPVVALVDLEATCTDDPALKATWRNEVIEVGLCLLRLNDGVVVEQRQWYVRPTSTKVTPFCTALTGIPAEAVSNAPSFGATMASVAQFLACHPAVRFWGSYGEYDRRQLERQALAEGCPNAMAPLTHFNVKACAQLALGRNRGLGLNRAVKRLGLQFYGRHHCGVDDAVNVAHVLRAVRELYPEELPR